MKKNVQKKPIKNEPIKKRSYVKQSDVPLKDLTEALRVPAVIFDNYAGKGTKPFFVAQALNIDAQGTHFKFLTGAALAYGLIEGGAQASEITVTELAKKILRPTTDTMSWEAKKEAVLKPRVFNTFLKKYDGYLLPKPELAINVLEELAVPRDKAAEVYDRILTSAESVGFVQETAGKKYVILDGISIPNSQDNKIEPSTDPEKPNLVNEDIVTANKDTTRIPLASTVDQRLKRVFITHGKNTSYIETLKKVLKLGELEAIVSVEITTISKPVPDKVLDDMRSCGAAIIHVDDERKLKDEAGVEHVIINPNVLIEIGAAMAMYGRRFILLVKDGVKLPSNLQGLFEVRYTGTTLDADVALKLLEVVKSLNNSELPNV